MRSIMLDGDQRFFAFGRVTVLSAGLALGMFACGGGEGDDSGDGDGESGGSASGGGTGDGDESGSGGETSSGGLTGGGGTSAGGSDGSSGGSGGMEQCPPCVPPPDNSCVGSGPCGCGPYTCPCGDTTCVDGQVCCNALDGICSDPGQACTF